MARQQYAKIACVTGANKGIGLAIVRQLALQYPSTPQAQQADTNTSNNDPNANPQPKFLIYLTARDETRGKEALSTLIDHDPQLRQSRALDQHGGPTQLAYLPLDIDSTESIKTFTETIRTKHGDDGGIDILVNNAGVALSGFDAKMARSTINTNYHGGVSLTEHLFPLIREGGRIVNVASMAGYLTTVQDSQGNRTRGYSNEIRNKFLRASTTQEVTALVEKFVHDVEGDTWRDDWPASAYAVSKAGLVGVTRVWARELQQRQSRTLVNVCCPGYVSTDMTGNKGHKEVDEGAQTPVLLALGDIGGSSGDFWKDEKIVPWERVSRE